MQREEASLGSKKRLPPSSGHCQANLLNRPDETIPFQVIDRPRRRNFNDHRSETASRIALGQASAARPIGMLRPQPPDAAALSSPLAR